MGNLARLFFHRHPYKHQNVNMPIFEAPKIYGLSIMSKYVITNISTRRKRFSSSPHQKRCSPLLRSTIIAKRFIAVVTTLFVLFMSTSSIATDWKSEAEKWKSEAKMWEAVAKSYEARYGWIDDQYVWCSMNTYIDFSGYDEPNCTEPSKPYCALVGDCDSGRCGPITMSWRIG